MRTRGGFGMNPLEKAILTLANYSLRMNNSGLLVIHTDFYRVCDNLKKARPVRIVARLESFP